MENLHLCKCKDIKFCTVHCWTHDITINQSQWAKPWIIMMWQLCIFIQLSDIEQETRKFGKDGQKDMDWPVGVVTSGSPLTKWLFSEPPERVLKSDLLLTKFCMTIKTDITKIPTSEKTHFEKMVSQPFWNFLCYFKFFSCSQITLMIWYPNHLK